MKYAGGRSCRGCEICGRFVRFGKSEHLDQATGEIIGSYQKRTGGRAPECGRVTFLPGAVRLSPGFRGRPEGSGGERGTVAGMSEESRRRLILRLVSIPWNEFAGSAELRRAFFVTLTYPDEFPRLDSGDIDHARIKRDLDVFGKRIRRIRGFRGLLWRAEYKERRSGENKGAFAPHFHALVLFDVDRAVKAFMRWVSASWYQVCGELDPRHRVAGTNVQRVHGHRDGKLFSYLSKYLAKADEGGRDYPGWTGRVWGTIGDLPQRDGITCELALDQWAALIRRVRRWRRGICRLGKTTVNKGGLVFGAGIDREWLLSGLEFHLKPPGEKPGKSAAVPVESPERTLSFLLGREWEQQFQVCRAQLRGVGKKERGIV